MKVIIVIIVMIIVHFNSIAQEFKIDASYNYMFANQWDKAIQTYNFSRPFNYEKQPLLMHFPYFFTKKLIKLRGEYSLFLTLLSCLTLLFNQGRVS